MVSRVYTPPYRPFVRNSGARPAGAGGDEDSSAATSQKAAQAQAVYEDTQRPQASPETAASYANMTGSSAAANLQSLQLSPKDKVPLNAVITDFHNTMDAIGIDEPTKAEVGVYLQAASLQGSKANPDVPFIKGSLKTAANTVDSYIGTVLGKPSTVVHDWVGALLQQDIDFKNQKPLSLPNSAGSKTSQGGTLTDASSSDNAQQSSTPVVQAKQATLSLEQKASLKTSIDAAKVAQSQGNGAEAQRHLEDARTQLGDSNEHPAIEGKIYRLQGRVYEQGGEYDKATTAYQQAADRFGDAQLPKKQADSLHQKAALLEDRGQLEDAHATYQQVQALDSQQGDGTFQARSLQDLGRVSLRMGQTDTAITHLEAAAQQAQTLPADARSELFATLGNAYRRSGQTDDAISAFNNAARSAKQSQDNSLYAGSLQQYAAALLEGGQSDRAMKAMQAYQNLQSA